MNMASPGDLVRTVAEVLGMPSASVAWYDRMLQEAGLRSKSGRGSGAARLTARDAANLLTALLASKQPKEAVDTVKLYAATRPDRAQSSKKAFAGAGLGEMAKLPSDQSFIDALEALLLSGIEGDLATWIAKHSRGKRGRKPMPLFEVAASMPGAVGDIRLAGILEGITAQVRYTTPGSQIESSPSPDNDDADLAQSRSVTARTIVRIADLLAGRGD
jgi:hypothetical protein